MAQIISFIGTSGVGKTTHLEKVIREFKKRGYKIAVVKHHMHDFEIDKPGKDTWRHAQAGADTVVLSSPTKIATIEKITQEKTLDEIAASLQEVDIVITEGFKKENKPKVEILRKAHSTEVISRSEELIALVTDCDIASHAPRFAFDEVEQLVDFLVTKFIKSF